MSSIAPQTQTPENFYWERRVHFPGPRPFYLPDFPDDLDVTLWREVFEHPQVTNPAALQTYPLIDTRKEKIKGDSGFKYLIATAFAMAPMGSTVDNHGNHYFSITLYRGGLSQADKLCPNTKSPICGCDCDLLQDIYATEKLLRHNPHASTGEVSVVGWAMPDEGGTNEALAFVSPKNYCPRESVVLCPAFWDTHARGLLKVKGKKAPYAITFLISFQPLVSETDIAHQLSTDIHQVTN